MRGVSAVGVCGRPGAVYILDEPSTGLHNKDAEKLLALFKSLVADGNTVIIIEHRLELIAQADYIIEMGLGGGTDGGEVVFTGMPEQMLQCAASRTGVWLRTFCNYVYTMPPLTTTDAEIDRICEAIKRIGECEPVPVVEGEDEFHK